LIGFATEDDWFDYRLENDPRFLERVERRERAYAPGEECVSRTCSGVWRREGRPRSVVNALRQRRL
jgi:hypothetical protein